MKIEQRIIRDAAQGESALADLVAFAPQLVLAFGAPAYFARAELLTRLAQALPQCRVAGCSTAGEISNAGVGDDTLVLTALRFDAVQLCGASTELQSMADSAAAGRRLAEQLEAAALPLKSVLVFGQGVGINGSALVDGMIDVLGPTLPITGGLAGDGAAFVRTWTVGASGCSDRALVAIGLAGDGLRVGYGSFGGWTPFGPSRRVTRCDGNILYELDNEPALGIYKRYLGEYAKDLPASGLLFPFAMMDGDQISHGLIRSILGVDEAAGSLTLAGEVREGGYLKLMHASTAALVDGASTAARASAAMSPLREPALALLVSCVGRKLMVGDRIDEEVDAVAEALGQGTTRSGFYSYGEISPFGQGGMCKLHNQTMTITTFSEA